MPQQQDKLAENEKERYERFLKADAKMELYRSRLEEVFEYCVPDRNTFYESTEGEDTTQSIYDDTAPKAIIDFSNNIQSFLMPPEKKWMSLIPSADLANKEIHGEVDIQEIKKQLQNVTDTLFGYLNTSNYATSIHEAFQDLAAGTGVILVNELDDPKHPFSFSSIPIADVAIEEGVRGTLQNFWRKWKIPKRVVQETWQNADLPQSFNSRKPEDEIELIEGTIYYPHNSYSNKYYYYVQLVDGLHDIVKEFRSYNPWIGFRFSVRPGEMLGRGPANFVLNFIRILNLLAEYELRGAKFQAFPIYMAANSGAINPYTLTLEPGSIIPTDQSFFMSGGQMPIQPLQGAGSPKFMQLSIEKYQQIVKDALLSDPLPAPQTAPQETATEISTRQQNWIRQNASSAIRLSRELPIPLIETCLAILRRKNLIPNLEIAGANFEIKTEDGLIDIDYKSPLLQMQNKEELQNFQVWIGGLLQMFGQMGLMAVNIEKVPLFMAERGQVDLDLVKNKDEVKQAFQKLIQNYAQTMQQQQGQEQQGAQQSAGAGMPDLTSLFGQQGQQGG